MFWPRTLILSSPWFKLWLSNTMATCSPPPAGGGGGGDLQGVSNRDEEAIPLMVASRFQRLDTAAAAAAAQVIEIAPAENASSRGVFYRPKERRPKVVIPEESDCLQLLWNGSQFSGVVCMALSTLTYGFMSILIQLLGGQSIPLLELVSIRCAIVASVCLVFLMWERAPLFGSPSTRGLTLLRGATSFFAMTGFTYSIRTLPLSDATLLSFATPVLASITARVFLNEKIRPRELAGALCSTWGLVLWLQPSMIFGDAVVPDRLRYLMASAVALLASFLGAVSHCLARAAGKAGESPLVLVFTFAIISSPAAALCALFLEALVVPSLFEFIGITAVSLTAFLAQLLMVRSLQLERISRATCVLYIEAIVLLTLEGVFLSRVPSVASLAGATVATVGVGLSLVWASTN